MAESRVADEFCGGVPVRTWMFTAASEYKERPRSGTTHPWFKRFASAFVPEGSVSPDYLEFQIWDSIQGLCSYVRGMLSSQAILRGVGVGNTAATTSSAIFHFFMRDFSGMLGGVLFAMFNGVGLDSHSKQWRLFADCFNNIGYVLELLSPVFPAVFLLLACLGSIARAITGVAAGATRAALTQHFAQSGNAADISAKEGSQETAVTLVGMLLGMALVHLASGAAVAVWAVFLVLTALHVYANVKAMRSLRLTSLNRPRANILLGSFMLGQKLPSIEGVAAKESLLAPPLAKAVGWLTNARGVEVVLGARFSDLVIRFFIGGGSVQ